VLYTFEGGADGQYPSEVVFGIRRHLRVEKVGRWCRSLRTETILHDLGNSGQDPNGSIVFFHNGLLFGTTTYLGADNAGSVFRLVP
jgi:hypothetical protein